MPTKPRQFRPSYTSKQTTEQRTKEAKEYRKLYNYQWTKLRTNYLRRNPLCVMCRMDGKTVMASVVDHIIPHKGDQALFYDENNWQPLCKPCHDKIKQRMEKAEGGITKY